MYDAEKTKSGSLRCGPNLYARKCEGGYELWRANRSKFAGSTPWIIGEVVATKGEALRWLRTYAKEMYQ